MKERYDYQHAQERIQRNLPPPTKTSEDTISKEKSAIPEQPQTAGDNPPVVVPTQSQPADPLPPSQTTATQPQKPTIQTSVVLNPDPIAFSSEQMEKEMEKKLLMIKRKQQDAEAWAKVDSMGPLSEERRVEEFSKALQAIAEKEEREIESQRQKTISWIIKNSSVVKKSHIKDLEQKELDKIVQQVKLENQKAEKDKKRKAQIIDELVQHKFGTKTQLSRWKEVDLFETYKTFKAKQKEDPQRFSLSEVSKTSEASKRKLAKPAPKKSKQASPVIKTDFKMMLLEGDTILDDACTYEEKPLIIQGRDPSTYAYKLQTTVTESHQTTVTIEQHIPTMKPGLTAADTKKRSGLTITEIEDPPKSAVPSTGKRSITAYTQPSQSMIKSWSFTRNSYHMVIIREDDTCQILRKQDELEKLSTEDLLTILDKHPERGPLLTETQIRDVRIKMKTVIQQILDQRQGGSK